MAAPTTIGAVIPVTLLEEATASRAATAAVNGKISLSNGGDVTPSQLFAWSLTASNIDPTTGLELVLLNSLPAPLTLIDCWPDPILQLRYPAESDGFGAFHKNQIPAWRDHPSKKGKIHGMGCYALAQMNIFHSYWGAMVFSCGDFPPIAVAWLKLPTSFDSAVTADASSYHDDAEYFYNKTIDSGKPVASQAGSEITISGKEADMVFVSTGFFGGFDHFACLTVHVKPT